LLRGTAEELESSTGASKFRYGTNMSSCGFFPTSPGPPG
jgi:hypothetical protein